MLFAAAVRASGVLGLLLAASTAVACPGIDHEHGLAPRSARVSTQPSGGTRLLRAHTWGNVSCICFDMQISQADLNHKRRLSPWPFTASNLA